MEVLASHHAIGQESVEPSREEWRASVQAARKRIDQFRLEGKSLVPPTPSYVDRQDTAARTALDDDSLQPGDIVSDGKELLEFKGTSANNRRIFVPLRSGANR